VNVILILILFFPHVRLLRYPLETIVCHGATISPSSPQSRLMNRFMLHGDLCGTKLEIINFSENVYVVDTWHSNRNV
jgi:hypothetical protein